MGHGRRQFAYLSKPLGLSELVPQCFQFCYVLEQDEKPSGFVAFTGERCGRKVYVHPAAIYLHASFSDGMIDPVPEGITAVASSCR